MIVVVLICLSYDSVALTVSVKLASRDRLVVGCSASERADCASPQLHVSLGASLALELMEESETTSECKRRP